jgi:hypothetical protein
MDPFSALGLVGNIIAFIDFGTKLFATARDIHQSKAGYLETNYGIQLATRQIKAYLESYNGCAADLDKSFIELAVACQHWGDELLALLDRCKPKRPGSNLAALSAAWRTVRSQDRKEHLQKVLVGLRDQLAFQFTELNTNKLNDIIQKDMTRTSGLASLHQGVQYLRDVIDAHPINDNILQEIHTLLRSSHQAMIVGKQELFLQELRFDEMNDRF